MGKIAGLHGAVLLPAALATVLIAFHAAAAQETTRASELREMRREKAEELASPEDPEPLERFLDTVQRFTQGGTGGGMSRFYGFGLKKGGLKQGSGIAAGINFDPFDSGARMLFEVDAVASHKRYWGAGGRAGYRLGSATMLAYGRHRHMPRERFYGFGPDSDEDARADYRLDETVGGGHLAVRLEDGLSLGGRGAYILSRPASGLDDNFTDALDRFAGDVPTLTLDTRYAAVGAWVEYDWRDPAPGRSFYRYLTATESDIVGIPLATDRGVHALAELVRYSGIGGTDGGFSRLNLQSQQFVPLRRGRNVFVFREYLALTGSGGERVPLYMLPTLGGAYTLRGYEFARFRDRHALLFNAEYRWQIWLFLDMALFVDAGQVFGNVEDVSLGRLHGSYGGGIRLRSSNRGIARIDVARSDEGMQVIVRLGTAF